MGVALCFALCNIFHFLCFVTLVFKKHHFFFSLFLLLTEEYTMFFRSYKFEVPWHNLGAAMKPYKGDNQVLCKRLCKRTIGVVTCTLSHAISDTMYPFPRYIGHHVSFPTLYRTPCTLSHAISDTMYSFPRYITVLIVYIVIFRIRFKCSFVHCSISSPLRSLFTVLLRSSEESYKETYLG